MHHHYNPHLNHHHIPLPEDSQRMEKQLEHKEENQERLLQQEMPDEEEEEGELSDSPSIPPPPLPLPIIDINTTTDSPLKGGGDSPRQRKR